MSNSASYTSTAKTLHWLMSLMIFGLLLLGFYMSDLPLSPEKLKLYSMSLFQVITTTKQCSSLQIIIFQ